METMETTNQTSINVPVPPQVSPGPLQPAGQPVVVPAPQFSQTGTLITTLTIASALSIGSNMADVKNKKMSISQAVLNAAAKGVAATIILNATARSTALQVVTTAGILAGAGFLIDTVMKKDKNKHHPRATPEVSE